MRPTILSIQSWVAYGHVGNAAAMFPLQRLGAEVWAVNTVQFSNHPGYGGWTGQVFGGEATRALLDGIARRGVLASCDAVLSGYLGEAATGDAVLQAVARVREANPAALYCCDPVMGDAGAIYVRPGIPELIAGQLLPEADLLTPNQFELETLTSLPCRSRAEIRLAVHRLQARMRPAGPRVVFVTSLQAEDTPEDRLDCVAADAHGIHLVRTERLPIAPSGAGDAVAALFLLHFLRRREAEAALAKAVSALHGVLRCTATAGSREMQLIAAQEELVRPSQLFVCEKF